MQFIYALGFVVFWIVLQAWILPWFGISTCIGNSCRSTLGDRPQQAEPAEPLLWQSPNGTSGSPRLPTPGTPSHGE